jgi:hypothetical protein
MKTDNVNLKGDNIFSPSSTPSYKQGILDSRVGCLGSSDASMVGKVGMYGIESLSESDLRRLAVMTGQVAHIDSYKTEAMLNGDAFEAYYFENYCNNTAKSNPEYISKQMSSILGYKCITHIDIEYYVEYTNAVFWKELKCLNDISISKAISKYKYQFAWHWMIGNDLYDNFILVGVLGNQDNFDNIEEFIFCPDDFKSEMIHITKGLALIGDFVKDFVYKPKEELEVSDLLAWDVELCEQAEAYLRQLYDAENKLKEFKEKMLQMMSSNGIKKISNDFFSISYVPESFTTRLDSDKLFAENPQLKGKYDKKTKKKAYCILKVK